MTDEEQERKDEDKYTPNFWKVQAKKLDNNQLTQLEHNETERYMAKLGVGGIESKSGDWQKAMADFYATVNDDPRYGNWKRNQGIVAGIEGGMDVLNTLNRLSTARRQQDVYEEEKRKLQDPTAPPTTPKSEELKSATESARRDLSQPIREIDPILQRNMDMLRAGMNAADTGSGGQAAASTSGRMAAINQSRTAMNQMIPAIEGIRRHQKQEYNRLVQAGISEDDMRFKQSMQKFYYAETRALQESRAVGALGAQANANVYGAQQELYGQLGDAVSPLMNFNYGGNKQTAPSSTPQGQTNPYEIHDGNPYKTGVMNANIRAATDNYIEPWSALGSVAPWAAKYGKGTNNNLQKFYKEWDNDYGLSPSLQYGK
jgi:hypothetical protein